MKLIALLVFPLAALAAGAVQDGPRPKLVLRLGTDAENCRNSEGDFIRLRNGDILFAYSKYLKGRGDDHDLALIAARRSFDGGEHWTTNDVVLAEPDGDDFNLMSVSLMRCRNGDIALFYLRKHSFGDCRPEVRFSSDEGATWDKPVKIVPDDEVSYYVLNNSRVIRLASGRLVVPVSQFGEFGCRHYKEDWRAKVLAYLSDDDGKTWRRARNSVMCIDKDGRRHVAYEPGVLELKDGRVLMNIRSTNGRQWYSHSDDGGLTWSQPVLSPLWSPNSPARLHRLRNGDILAVWNDHESRPDLRAAGPSWAGGARIPYTLGISKDEGKSFPIRRDLETDPNLFCCYPAVLERDDGTLLLGYCAENELRVSWIKTVPLDWIYGGTD